MSSDRQRSAERLTATLNHLALMGFEDFMAAQAANVQALSDKPHFASLVPVVDRMYRCVVGLAGPNYSPTPVKLLVLCHRELFVAASQIQRGLPFDAAANTRRAVEIAKVAWPQSATSRTRRGG
jgi:hypothetical protein